MARLETLETERLTLRPQRPEDAVTFRTLWKERDHRVPPHRRIDAGGRPTVEDVAASIRAESQSARLRLLTVVRTQGGEVLGYCGLNGHGSGTPEEPELAYELLCDCHGQGYATEAARAVVAWADEAGYRRLRAGVWDWNVASLRVLDKLGFRVTGQVERRSEHGASLLTVRER
ncbi:GNAT family N-acetyltransferase [Pseudactinotalea suaedae]|uniref:GNAT family N-acetyltransferase n=1 Tax=Pseudactinotalea suaedae TaxID=1524924 RepID=UPI001F501FB6|nr:GNAT family N-acetyltransferase [Pseudactinotalea suaedae]